ncbi:hypothetical protein CTA1_4947 [Colletotrichum tanaceti]|uniref:Uncharacterized protein n=1 Tax=Colletotrichum tanaceti TaxID=1306861 RepID=A0A4U6WZK2_9PEZI|nr:hypothetical protein CTA1_4947 [Colletotrichum tanaceti]
MIARKIINTSAEDVPREKIAALTGDVGQKLKHYATKNQSASTIYNDVRRQPIEGDSAELSSVIAIRSHIDIDMMEKVVLPFLHHLDSPNQGNENHNKEIRYGVVANMMPSHLQ